MIAYVNNEFIPIEDATIGIGDLSIQRGYGIFDFFRTSNNTPLFLDDYIDRFLNSAEVLRLKHEITKQQLRDIVFEMVRLNNIPTSGFRMILTGGYSPDSFEPAPANLVVIQQAIELPTAEKFNKGVKIITHEYMRDLPHAKSINYLMGIYLRDKIVQQQAEDVLYYKDDNVLEFPRSNVFIVTDDGTLATPDENVLLGITRMRVIELAQKQFKVEERPVTLTELENAAEVFVTSTTKRLLPVVSINGKPVGAGEPGKVTRALHNAFLEMEASLIAQ